MSWHYSAFGLGIEASGPIPGLAVSEGLKPVDVRIDLSGSRHEPPPPALGHRRYISPHRGQDGRPVLQVWDIDGGGGLRFLYDDGVEFILAPDGRRIRAHWPASVTVDRVAPLIVGPVLAFAMRLLGIVSLHASAIAVDGRAIALVGPPGSGKSTTAAAFARLGYPVLSDDVVALTERDGDFLAHLAHPWIRLWPESSEALFGSADALPRIVPEDPLWNKQYLDLPGQGYSTPQGPLKLGAIYMLYPREAQSGQGPIAELRGQEKAVALVANTYGNYLLDPTQRAHEFKVLSRVAGAVPIRRVVPCAGLDRLPELCQAILEHYRSSPLPVGRQGQSR